MAASHLVAGEDVEHGGDEEAEAGGNENRIEHVQVSLCTARTSGLVSNRRSVAEFVAAAYKIQVAPSGPAYRTHINLIGSASNPRLLARFAAPGALMQIKPAAIAEQR
jgi:hypothetical protein